jgi:hypothetical protein
MNEIGEIAAPGGLAIDEPAQSRTAGLVQRAPEPDVPHPRDRRGAQLGMVILLVGGGLIWAGLAALFLFVLR